MMEKDVVNRLIIVVAFAGFFGTVIAQIINVATAEDLEDDVTVIVYAWGGTLLAVALVGALWYWFTGIGSDSTVYTGLETLGLVFIMLLTLGYFSYMMYVDSVMMGDNPDECNGGSIFSMILSGVFMTFITALLLYIGIISLNIGVGYSSSPYSSPYSTYPTSYYNAY